MLHMSRLERKYSIAFIIAFLIIVLANIFLHFSSYITGLSSILYCFFIIAWASTVAWRIVHKIIRRNIIAIAASLFLLFAIRFGRYDLFKNSPLISRYLWYFYYFPYIAMPMMSLSAASNVGKGENEKMSPILKAEWVISGLLILGALTNDLHHFVLRLVDENDINTPARYNWLYYVILTWAFAITLSSYILLIKRCRLSQCRQYWYIPVIYSSIGIIFLIIYVACGESPVISGIKLYNIQEAYVVLFIGLWEGCIKIGLIPSNTGYNALFERSGINAVLKNTEGEEVFRSGEYSDTTDKEDYMIKNCKIKGGSVTWSEDVSAINRINSALEEATEQIEAENDLIDEENRVAAEKARYETQNRLYDNITKHTYSQLLEIDEALNETDEFDLRMKFCLLLGTYVKRCSNLMLIADNCPYISTNELYLSINESFEFMEFLGIESELMQGAERSLPAAQIIAAYDVFEAVIESALETISACSIMIMPSENVLLSIETDAADSVPENIILHSAGLKLTSSAEDDIRYYTLSIGGEDAE